MTPREYVYEPAQPERKALEAYHKKGEPKEERQIQWVRHVRKPEEILEDPGNWCISQVKFANIPFERVTSSLDKPFRSKICLPTGILFAYLPTIEFVYFWVTCPSGDSGPITMSCV
jgi:hypothetical protein